MSFTGVVLMGGLSTRMGTDKAFLKHENQFYYQRAAHILEPFCHEVILSINKSQAYNHAFEYPTIIDMYEEQGPLGGVLSVFKYKKAPLLILAVDLIQMQKSTIKSLIDLHIEQNGVTLYFNEDKACYEPLLSIWEPSMLINLEIYFNQGGRSFQKFFTQYSIEKMHIPDVDSFVNINRL